MKNPISILALGDSYTIGEGVEKNERWIDQLSLMLESKGVNIDHKNVIAQTGWTTGELIHAINGNKVKPIYGLVFLLIGVNNQYRGYPLNEYRNEFVKLLSLGISFAQNKSNTVYVLSIPDWANTPFAEGKDKKIITEEIDAFNKINREEACHANVNYIDITDITRTSPLNNNMLAIDGLHPSGIMYRLWAERIFNHLMNQSEFFKQ